jgi:hypothetical protein
MLHIKLAISRSKLEMLHSTLKTPCFKCATSRSKFDIPSGKYDMSRSNPSKGREKLPDLPPELASRLLAALAESKASANTGD